MSRKISPYSFRLGINKDWKSRWLFQRRFNYQLEEDYLIREEIKRRVGRTGIDKIEIERLGEKLNVIITAARPGLIIGRGGKKLEELNKAVIKMIRKNRLVRNIEELPQIKLDIKELKRTDVSASVVSQYIATELEQRKKFRRVMKTHLANIMQHPGVLGAKIRICGRLDGSEHARCEHLSKGKLPQQTIRSNIDYGESEALTVYGKLGIKVWIYKGEIFT